MNAAKEFGTAEWIASPVVGGPRTCPPAPFFRREFHLPAAPRRAVLHATALGIYDAEINGRPVTDAVFLPGWTDYRIRVQTHRHDVTAWLQAGENALGAVLGDGWYSGHVANKDRQFYGDRPRLLFRLVAELEDGSTFELCSDATWKTTVGPILENDLIMGEAHDARLALGSWSSANYDDATWSPVLVAEAPAIELTPAEGPPVRRHEILAARWLNPPDSPTWHPRHRRYDLGQNITGRLRLRVRGPRGAHLRLRHAEVLNPDGSLYTENLRSARATDFFTLSGEGVETYEPRFTFHGFRYADVSWPEGEVVIESVEGVVLHSVMDRTGEFSCSHPLLNQLTSNIVWGQKGNFLEVPTDCPQRDERLGWTGDAQVFIRTAAFFMDVQAFFDKWLQDMRDAQGADGAIPPIIPFNGAFELANDGGPAWADAVFICPWTLYQCYGDPDVLRRHYACMARYMDYLAARKVKDYIRAHPDVDAWGGFGDWLALDGSGRTDGGTPKDLIGTAHYAHNADLMARAASVLGHAEDAARWQALHGEIVAAFRRRFVTPDGFLAAGTQTAYVLALRFHLVPDGVRATTAAQLVRLIRQNGSKLGTGFVGTPHLLHVLEDAGHLDVAYQLLEEEAFPSWLFPVKNGATTIWERWDGWTPAKGFQDKGMNSFNHYAYGAVGDWMVSTVAGLEIAAPGFREILFKPRPGGSLTRASARLRTPRGEAAIAWTLEGDALELELEVPEGSSAALSLPEGWIAPAEALPSGRHSLTARRM